MKRITNGFEKLSLAEFSKRLELIVSRMTANPNFTNLQMQVQTLAASAVTYSELRTKAAGRDNEAILIRNAARSEITTMLHNLGQEVTAVAKSNVPILASSGFNYSQDRRNTADLVKPDPPIVTLGVNKGELDCRTFTQPGCKSINYYITTDPDALNATDNSGWQVFSYNKTKYTFKGLTGGQRYYIKVGLVGVRGQEVISDAVSFIPQ